MDILCPGNRHIMKTSNLQIEKIQNRYGMKILYACESGSRAWGLETSYSDKNIGLIYYRNLESYISLSEKPDTINLSEHTEFDGFGWDLKKVLQGLLKSNAVLYDWLQAKEPFIGCSYTHTSLQTISQQCFDAKKVIFHYLGLGNNLIHKYKKKEDIQIKAYLLLIRSTLAAIWVKEKGTAPPLLFSELMSIAESHPTALMPIHKIVMTKKQAKPEKYVPKIPILDQIIMDNRKSTAAYAEGLPPKTEIPFAAAEQLLHSVIFQKNNRQAL